MSFKTLLSELDVLKKAMDSDGDTATDGSAADDAAIAAAAAADGELGGGGDAGAADDGGKKKKEEDKEKDLAKSFEVTLPNGEKMKAVDGTALAKALIAQTEQVVAMQTAAGGLLKALANQSIAMKKANAELRTENGDLKKALDKQGEDLAAIRKSLEAIGGAGRGQRSATVVLPNSPEGKPQTMAPRDFMQKALSAQAAGKITGETVSKCETYIGKGMQIPDQLVAQVLNAAG